MNDKMLCVFQQLLACGYQYRVQETTTAEVLAERDGEFEIERVEEGGMFLTYLTKFRYEFQRKHRSYWMQVSFYLPTLQDKEFLRLTLGSFGDVTQQVRIVAPNKKRFFPDFNSAWQSAWLKDAVRNYMTDWEEYVVEYTDKFFADRAKIHNVLDDMNYVVLATK
jgi:hypothetical protein